MKTEKVVTSDGILTRIVKDGGLLVPVTMELHDGTVIPYGEFLKRHTPAPAIPAVPGPSVGPLPAPGKSGLWAGPLAGPMAAGFAGGIGGSTLVMILAHLFRLW